MSTRCFSQAISNTSLSPVGLSVLSKQAGLLTLSSSSSVAFPVYFDRPVAFWTLTPLLQWRDRVGFAPSFPIILVRIGYALRNLFPPMKLCILIPIYGPICVRDRADSFFCSTDFADADWRCIKNGMNRSHFKPPRIELSQISLF